MSIPSTNYSSIDEVEDGPVVADPSSPLELFCPGTSVAHDLEEARKNKKKLIIVCIICFTFMAAEIIGGIFSGSLAIISDAAHLFTDIAGFVISLVALYMASRPATRNLSYGFHRAEVIGAVFSVSLIWTVTIYLIIEAIDRINHPHDIDGQLMLILAVLGLLLNFIMAFTLHQGSHHKKRNRMEVEAIITDVENGMPKNKNLPPHNRQKNLNIRAALIHVIGDFFQSIGVLFAAIMIYINPKWTIADPISTFFFSAIVLVTTYNLLKEAIHVLMEGTPSDINPEILMHDLLAVEGVKRVHDLHIWCLSPTKTTITVHVVLEISQIGMTDEPLISIQTYSKILAQCQDLICGKYQIHHSTIQIECEEDMHSHCLPSLCTTTDISCK